MTDSDSARKESSIEEGDDADSNTGIVIVLILIHN